MLFHVGVLLAGLAVVVVLLAVLVVVLAKARQRRTAGLKSTTVTKSLTKVESGPTGVASPVTSVVSATSPASSRTEPPDELALATFEAEWSERVQLGQLSQDSLDDMMVQLRSGKFQLQFATRILQFASQQHLAQRASTVAQVAASAPSHRGA